MMGDKQKEDEHINEVLRDWKLPAQKADYFLFWVFFTITSITRSVLRAHADMLNEQLTLPPIDVECLTRLLCSIYILSKEFPLFQWFVHLHPSTVQQRQASVKVRAWTMHMECR